MKHLLLSLVLVGVAGCSSWGEKAAQWSGHAVAKAGEVMHPVIVAKAETDSKLMWVLKQQYNEPPVLDGFQMDYKARELCPKGYLKEEVYALRPAKFAVNHAACVSAECHYTLVWKIRCDKVPHEPFSIFGKF